MIPYYEKNCYETAITTAKAQRLSQALKLLHKKYNPLILSTVSCLPEGEKAVEEHSSQQLTMWFKAARGRAEDVLLALFTPRKDSSVIFAIQLKAMENLQTDFGKRYHKKGYAYIETSAYSLRTDAGAVVKEFHSDFGAAMQKVFKLRKCPAASSISLINKTFDVLKTKKNTTEAIPETLIPALDLLKQSDFRSIVARAKQAKDPTAENIFTSAGLKPEVGQPLLVTAVAAGILIQHYNVVCLSCKTPLARVPSKAAIRRMVQERVACPKCKNCMTDTSFVDCYVVADHIASVLDGSKWLDLFVRHKLKPYPQVSKVVTEVIDGPNELDLVANLDGKLLLAELKGCRFSIGHAYSFVGKCSQYKPDITMIIATDGVDADVKEYIKNTGLQTHYVESLESLQVSFQNIFSQINGQTLSSLVSEVPWTALVNRALLSALGVTMPMPDESMSFAYARRMGFPPGAMPWEP